MLFNSYSFIIFFPIVCFLYYLVPARIKYLWLLIASYYFYMSWNAAYAILIAISTVTTWGAAILVERLKCRKIVVLTCVILNLCILFYFKYSNFFIEQINSIIGKVGVEFTPNYSLVLPVGISFYTFQATGYIVDVYRKEILPEKNILRYALFVSFFPQLVAGPIERSRNLLPQIQNIETNCRISYQKITDGLVYMLYGFFLKLVIADRISIVVDTVFNNYMASGGFELIIAAICFSIQIFCDFYSYSVIAIGAAQVMGFELMENFNTPYFAVNITDFWRRWHISLSTWLRDYIYIPLGGNRKGKVRKYINLMLTFLISGLWHGANWTYVVWGGYHGVCQVISDATKEKSGKILELIGFKTNSVTFKIYSMILTFLVATIGWIIFRAPTITDALHYIYNIVVRWDPWAINNGYLYEIGLNRYEWNVLVIAILIMFCFELVRYLSGLRMDRFLNTQGAVTKGLAIWFLGMYIYIFGIYGVGYDAAAFIYFQF